MYSKMSSFPISNIETIIIIIIIIIIVIIIIKNACLMREENDAVWYN
jgi:hypothetical protein